MTHRINEMLPYDKLHKITSFPYSQFFKNIDSLFHALFIQMRQKSGYKLL